MWEIKLNREEIKEMLKELQKRKGIRRDKEVSGYNLKKCRQEMDEPIFYINECSLKTGKVSKEWKRADIIPNYKNGNKEEPLNYRPVTDQHTKNI